MAEQNLADLLVEPILSTTVSFLNVSRVDHTGYSQNTKLYFISFHNCLMISSSLYHDGSGYQGA